MPSDFKNKLLAISDLPQARPKRAWRAPLAALLLFAPALFFALPEQAKVVDTWQDFSLQAQAEEALWRSVTQAAEEELWHYIVQVAETSLQQYTT